MSRNYRIVEAEDERNAGRVWVLFDDERHCLESFDALIDWQMTPCPVETISYDEIMSYPLSFPIRRMVSRKEDIQSIDDARIFFLQNKLKGEGIEFGAAVKPMPLPPRCRVRYADCFQPNEGSNSAMHGNFVPVTYHTNMESMQGIANNSQDFVVMSHVIEHTKNPILALQKIYEKLRPGGMCFMAIPHMDYTFDKNRELTTCRHLVKDFTDYKRERDVAHIIDSIIDSAENVEANVAAIVMDFLQGNEHDVHWHTFTETNFSEMMQWFNNNVYPWSKIEIVPHIPFPLSNEFYLIAEK